MTAQILNFKKKILFRFIPRLLFLQCQAMYRDGLSGICPGLVKMIFSLVRRRRRRRCVNNQIK